MAGTAAAEAQQVMGAATAARLATTLMVAREAVRTDQERRAMAVEGATGRARMAPVVEATMDQESKVVEVVEAMEAMVAEMEEVTGEATMVVSMEPVAWKEETV